MWKNEYSYSFNNITFHTTIYINKQKVVSYVQANIKLWQAVTNPNQNQLQVYWKLSYYLFKQVSNWSSRTSPNQNQLQINLKCDFVASAN